MNVYRPTNLFDPGENATLPTQPLSGNVVFAAGMAMKTPFPVHGSGDIATLPGDGVSLIWAVDRWNVYLFVPE
jgi:hypothetical protein